MTARRAPGGADALPEPLLDDAARRRLERLSLALRQRADGSGGRGGRRRAPATDFVDHRPYSPGDDRRHIDWHAAARQDGVHVKVGRVLQSAEVHLVLDRSPSVTAWPAKWRQLRRIAAALGWVALSTGDRLTVRAHPALEPRAEAWPGGRGTALGPGWLAWLERLGGAATDRSVLAPTLAGLHAGQGRGGLVVVLTDGWLHEDLDGLTRQPAGLWDLLLICVLDRSELDPPAAGPVTLADEETGETLELNLDAATLAAYRAHLLARFEQVASLVRRSGHGFALFASDVDLEAVVLPYLLRRAALRG